MYCVRITIWIFDGHKLYVVKKYRSPNCTIVFVFSLFLFDYCYFFDLLPKCVTYLPSLQTSQCIISILIMWTLYNTCVVFCTKQLPKEVSVKYHPKVEKKELHLGFRKPPILERIRHLIWIHNTLIAGPLYRKHTRTSQVFDTYNF